MKITIRPKQIQCRGFWYPKVYGVIFVECKEFIDPVFGALCLQDSYWQFHKDLIKVAPTEIDSEFDLRSYCEYVGKTDIYDIQRLKDQLKSMGIEIIIFQYEEDSEY